MNMKRFQINTNKAHKSWKYSGILCHQNVFDTENDIELACFKYLNNFCLGLLLFLNIYILNNRTYESKLMDNATSLWNQKKKLNT